MSRTIRTHVLLVDDSDDDALLTRSVLSAVEEQRYVVTRAKTRSEALDLLASAVPDVVLLDLHLGADSGLDVLREARARGFDGAIVMLSAAREHALDLLASDTGADDWLDKLRLEPRLLERVVRHSIAHRRTQRELRERNAALAKLVEEKNFFVGMAAHDLRSPIGAIVGYARLLEEDVETLPRADVRAMVATIARSAEHTAALLDDLLDLSSIEAGTLVLRTQRASLEPIVQRAMDELRPIARAKSIQIDLVTRDPGPVDLDPARVGQVVANLLSNAIKYSHPGGAVQVRIEPAGDEVHLAVEDHGVGIPADAVGRLFQPFRKARGTGTAGEKSTGLGLSIVRRIVEAHGGRVSVESSLGRGATFHVFLPARRGADAIGA